MRIPALETKFGHCVPSTRDDILIQEVMVSKRVWQTRHHMDASVTSSGVSVLPTIPQFQPQPRIPQSSNLHKFATAGAHLAKKQEAFEWLTLHQGKHRGNEKCRQSKPRTTLSNRKAIPSPRRHGLTIPAPEGHLVLPCLALGQSRIILPPRVVARTLGLHFSNPPHLSDPPPSFFLLFTQSRI